MMQRPALAVSQRPGELKDPALIVSACRTQVNRSLGGFRGRGLGCCCPCQAGGNMFTWPLHLRD